MKLLSISEGKGFFLGEAGSPTPIDQITKEDLLRLVDLTLTLDAPMDAYDVSLLLNQAHQIIYENVWTRLSELGSRKKEFLDDSKRAFLTEYERYKNDVPSSPEAASLENGGAATS